MATKLYKNGEAKFFKANRVQALLENGWTVTREQKPVPITKEEADINESGVLNATEVRAAAKDAGMNDWKKARISTLKKRLGYES